MLQSVAHEVAIDNQIILFTYRSGIARMWKDMTIQLAFSLEQLGLENYVILADNDLSCDEITLASNLVRPRCITNSVLHRTHGYDGSSMTDLWVVRYHTAAAFSEAGFGVTLMDADCAVTNNFMPYLKQMEVEYALVVLQEGPANGGLWHLRASKSKASAALWIIKQIERQTTLFMKHKIHEHGKDAGITMDQVILGNAIRVAADPDGSAFDFWESFFHASEEQKRHEIWTRHPQQEQPAFQFQKSSTRDILPFRSTLCSGMDACEKRLTNFLHNQIFVQAASSDYVQFAVIRTPFDAEDFDESEGPEKILRAPAWLWSHGDPLENGFTDQTLVYHLLGVTKSWQAGERAGGHIGRYAQWIVRPGMKSIQPPVGKRFAELEQNLVDHAARQNFETMQVLIRDFFDHCAFQGFIPIVPAFSCASPWLKKSEESLLGIYDHRVVDDGNSCFPSPMNGDNCIPNEHYFYPMTVDGLERQRFSFIPPLRETNEGVKNMRKACFNK